MDDHRVMGGPSLGGVDCGNRLLIARIGPKTIDGLRRKGDQPSLSQKGQSSTETSVAVAETDSIAIGHLAAIECDGRRWNRNS